MQDVPASGPKKVKSVEVENEFEILVLLLDNDCSYYPLSRFAKRKREGSLTPGERYLHASQTLVSAITGNKHPAHWATAVIGEDQTAEPGLMTKFFSESWETVIRHDKEQARSSERLELADLKHVKICIAVSSETRDVSRKKVLDDALCEVVPHMESLQLLLFHAPTSSRLATDIWVQWKRARLEGKRTPHAYRESEEDSTAQLTILCWSSPILNLGRLWMHNSRDDFVLYFLEQLAEKAEEEATKNEKSSSSSNDMSTWLSGNALETFNNCEFTFPIAIERLVEVPSRISGNKQKKFCARMGLPNRNGGKGIGKPRLLTHRELLGAASIKLSRHILVYPDEFVRAAADLVHHLETFAESEHRFITRGQSSLWRLHSIFLIARVLGWIYHLQEALAPMDKILHFGDFCNDLVAELDSVLSPAVAGAGSDLSVVIATVGAFMTNERELPPVVMSFDSYRKHAQTYDFGFEQLVSPAALLAYESRSPPVNTGGDAVCMVYRLYDNLVEDRAKIPKLAEVIEFFIGRLRRLTKMD